MKAFFCFFFVCLTFSVIADPTPFSLKQATYIQSGFFGYSVWVDSVDGARYYLGQTENSSANVISPISKTPVDSQQGGVDLVVFRVEANDAITWYTYVGSSNNDIAGGLIGYGLNILVMGSTSGTINSQTTSNSDVYVVYLNKLTGAKSTTVLLTSTSANEAAVPPKQGSSMSIAGTTLWTISLKNGDWNIIWYDLLVGLTSGSTSFGGTGSETPYTLVISGNNVYVGGECTSTSISSDQSFGSAGCAVKYTKNASNVLTKVYTIRTSAAVYWMDVDSNNWFVYDNIATIRLFNVNTYALVKAITVTIPNPTAAIPTLLPSRFGTLMLLPARADNLALFYDAVTGENITSSFTQNLRASNYLPGFTVLYGAAVYDPLLSLADLVIHYTGSHQNTLTKSGYGTEYTLAPSGGARCMDFVSFSFKTGILTPLSTTASLTTSEMTTARMTTASLTTSGLTTSQMTTSQMTTAQLTTSEMTTSEMTTSKMTTAQLTTSEMTTAQLTTSEMTTSKMTTAQMTTFEMTTAQMTTSEMTTSQMTTSEMTTAEMTTAQLTTAEMTTSEMTTAQMTTSEMTTAEMTTSELTTSEMTTAQLTTSEMTTSEMTTSEMTTAQMTTSELTTSEMTTAQLTTSELTTAEMTTSEMTTSELTTSEMTTSQLTTSEMTTSEITTSELTTSEMTTSQLTTSELTTSDMTTSLMTTYEVTSAAFTTFILTTNEVTTSDLTTAYMTTESMTTAEMTTAEMTTSEMTTSELTTSEMTTAQLTTSELTTAEMTTSELTTSEMTTSELTTAQLTTSEMTTSELTTSEMTTAQLTTSEMTTAQLTTFEMTTAEMTTAEMTTSEMTTAQMTTSEMTTAQLTTSELTTSQMTTSEMTTSEMTTSEMTTSEMTTAGLTTSQLTTSEMTTAQMTTSEMTTSQMTTAQFTSAALSTSRLTTSPMTTDRMTTAQFTSASFTSSRMTTARMTTARLTTSRMTTAPFNAGFTTSVLTTSFISNNGEALVEVTSADDQMVLDQKFIGQVVIPVINSKPNTQTTFWLIDTPNLPFLFDQTIYVFKTPYTGNPSLLSSASGIYAQSTTLDGRSWVFRSTVQFVSGTSYYLYFGSPVSGLFDISSSGTKRAIVNPCLVFNGATYDDGLGSLLFVLSSTTNDGEIKGDPIFYGFNNQLFEFNGVAGTIYNVYNDPYVNLNSFFDIANTDTNKGSVMTQIGVKAGGHDILVDIDADRSSSHFNIIIDGTETRIDSRITSLEGCVDVQFKTALLISTLQHTIYVYPREGTHRHVNVPYLNVHIHQTADETKIGGVLGQTSLASNQLDTVAQDFVESSIFGVSTAEYYDGRVYQC